MAATPRLDRILVPTDLSELGDQAVAYACTMAPPGATIDLLHVLEPVSAPNPLYAHYQRGPAPSAHDLDALQHDLEHALQARVIETAFSWGRDPDSISPWPATPVRRWSASVRTI